MNDELSCPLCGSEASSYYKDTKRHYMRCTHCMLVFVSRRHWLSIEAEKATYDLHENHEQDPGYRQFLSRLSRPLLERLNPNHKGLDFGCGPGPTLSVMFEEQGHSMDLYDPLYAHDPSVFGRSYDFICASEVVEHLREPGKEFEALFKMLKHGGWLGIMTKLARNLEAFSQWHYIRDPTHICFYSRRTFEFIARRYSAELSFMANDVILLKKAAHRLLQP